MLVSALKSSRVKDRKRVRLRVRVGARVEVEVEECQNLCWGVSGLQGYLAHK
jgi:hypothetical protein